MIKADMKRIGLLLTIALCFSMANSYGQSSNADVDKGLELYQQKNFSAAIQLFKKTAEAGNANGMYYLAFCHRDGQGTAENKDEALRLFRESANKGCEYSYNPLGQLFEEKGMQDEAFKCYKKSAEAKFPDGQYNLAMCYYNGVGTLPNDSEARKWLEKSAKQDFKPALTMLKIIDTPAFKMKPVISFDGLQQTDNNASFNVCIKATTGKLTKNPIVYLNDKELPKPKWFDIVEKTDCDLFFKREVTNLKEGENIVRVEATNRAGTGHSELKINYISGKKATINWTSTFPYKTDKDSLHVTANISSTSKIGKVKLIVNNKEMSIDVIGDTYFELDKTLTLDKGNNEIVLSVTNAAGETVTTPQKVNLEKKIALVIGNSKYRAKGGELTKPYNDANDLAEKLVSLGYEVNRCIDADRDKMEEGIEIFCRKAEKSNLALFYFSGHGIGGTDGDNFLVPIDAPAIDSSRKCISAKGVLKDLEKSGCNLKILILDACRTPSNSKGSGSNSGLSTMTAPSGTFIAYAAAPGEPAYEGNGRNSIFTEALLETFNRQEELPITTFFTLVTGATQEKAKKLEKTQDPWTASNVGVLYPINKK